MTVPQAPKRPCLANRYRVRNGLRRRRQQRPPSASQAQQAHGAWRRQTGSPNQLAPLARRFISWRLFRFTNSMRPGTWTWPDRRPSGLHAQKPQGRPAHKRTVPIWKMSYTDRISSVATSRGRMQPRPDKMAGLACCALRSVSKPRATLRAVWWFSRQAAENRRESKEPKLEAQTYSC
jgi:hypothetical protein